jgi:hypothetical protein
MNKEQLAFEEAVNFDVWMREKVQSIYYPDNEEMTEAHQRVIEHHLELIWYEDISR